MSDIQDAYNVWADQYDTNRNRTRDVEATALRQVLHPVFFNNCLELGCGTGKNTAWLLTRAEHITAVDFSEKMLEKARQKNYSDKVSFVQADILQDWAFAVLNYDLVVFSLVLEHVKDLEAIFEKVKAVLAPQGYVYIGELHPFKQYNGTKARYETSEGTQELTCFNHHVADFIQAAFRVGFEIIDFQEHFDNDDRSQLPRILSLLLKSHKVSENLKVDFENA